MNNNVTPLGAVAPSGSVLWEIVFMSLLHVGEMEEVTAARRELERLEEEAAIGKPDGFGNDLSNAASELYHCYAERMFMMGWNLLAHEVGELQV